MTGAPYPVVGWDGILLFCSGWPWTEILQIFASLVAEIRDVCHCAWPRILMHVMQYRCPTPDDNGLCHSYFTGSFCEYDLHCGTLQLVLALFSSPPTYLKLLPPLCLRLWSLPLLCFKNNPDYPSDAEQRAWPSSCECLFLLGETRTHSRLEGVHGIIQPNPPFHSEQTED
jgi:hypothetical protein